jgi:outer membrane murein-binding lipoprotein Lpp
MHLKALPKMLFLLLLGVLAVPATADDDLRALVKELSAQVKQLSSRVHELEHKLAQEQETRRQAATSPANPDQTTATAATQASATAPTSAMATEPARKEAKPVTVGDVKGSYKIPGTDTSLAIGGYAKLDAIYNSASARGGSNNINNLMLIPSAIPVGSNLGEHSETVFNARESRIWLKSFTPTILGDLNTYLEMDFMSFQPPGDAPVPGDERVTNGYSPRLRHAYGSLGNLLGGQTWTTFLNVAALPELNDFGGPIGQIFVRQALIRWTQPFSLAGAPLEFQTALENPETTLTLPNGDRITPDDDRAPDVVARLNYNPVWGSLSVAGLARQIRYSDNNHHQASEAWGGAVSLAGKVRTYGLDNFRFMLNYGNGLGRYTSYNLFNDAVLNSSGHIDLLDVYGGFLAYQHFWSPAWRSTVAYGFAHADYPPFVAQSVSKQAQSVHVNLLWSPLLQATIGLEYIYGLRQLENGQEGDLQRVEFSTRFSF